MVAVDRQGEERQAADQQSGEAAVMLWRGLPELPGGELIFYRYYKCRQRQLLHLPGPEGRGFISYSMLIRGSRNYAGVRLL
jgi:hypothetical protein